MQRSHIRSRKAFLAFGLALATSSCYISAPIAAAAGSSSVITSQICNGAFTPPTIGEPVTGYSTTSSSVVVKGTGAPGVTLTILVNGVTKATTSVAGDGTFAAEVPVALGGNSLVAREKDACNNTKESTEVIISREQLSSGDNNSGDGNSGAGPLDHGSVPGMSGGSVPDKKPSSGGNKTIESPKITSLREGEVVYVDHIWVGGTGRAGSIVIIYVNSKEAARVVVDEDGAYGVDVRLDPGSNTIKAVQEYGGKRSESRPWHVVYEPRGVGKNADGNRLIATIAVVAAATLPVAAGGVWIVYRRLIIGRRGKIL